ncbi:CPBP family intramembrane glutamic endopeptidase [Spirulina subsalsa]|uniref:CPBP family intramembrane glutamic endopeptidase n=1 Tax=Spirulina subsalsa TaxID=54311 RepID=UPI0002D7CE1B|nr:type II CAAX endopeptidase family protein [Spirulina subsalsa]
MTPKRIILILLTGLAVAKLLFSLLFSVNQPQVQSRLQLYQTNLILQAAELQVEGESDPLPLQYLLGENPYSQAQEQYEQASGEIHRNFEQLESQLKTLLETDSGAGDPQLLVTDNPSTDAQPRLQNALGEMTRLQAEIGLNKGILQAKQEQVKAAQDTWEEVMLIHPGSHWEATARVLMGLWSAAPLIAPDGESLIQSHLQGWFRDESLSQLYQVQGNSSALAALVTQRQQAAEQALLRLILIGGIPFLGGILGVVILVGLILGLILHKERSLLAGTQNALWETPWDGEIIWQVLIVGFFFISQILLPEFLPLIVQGIGLDPLSFDLRGKAFYVLTSYVLMMVGGLGVLYLSLKPFFPLPDGWFKVKWLSNWPLWGVGGYFAAIPLVVVISLVNQQIWQGQGGSNPIISLALQSQDTLALLIFFSTASLAAPLFEEIIFRGFFLPSLTRYIPVWGAITLSSLVFAIAHLNISEVLPLTVLGMVLGFVYVRSRNLLASICLHSLWNSGTLLSLFLLGNS